MLETAATKAESKQLLLHPASDAQPALIVVDSGVVWVQLTGGISKGMAMLTLDQDYISRFRNQPMTAQQRLIYALQALGVGMYEGVIGQRLPGLPVCLSVCLCDVPWHTCV